MPEFRELLDGYHRFRRNDYHRHRGRWRDLAEGQAPPVMIISCCDSRVDPTIVFDTEPGPAFVLRNVANLMPPFGEDDGQNSAPAAVEFAVLGLGIKHIVVVGHGACGGIKAALQGGDLGAPGESYIDRWIRIIKEPRDRVVADDSITDKQHALELEAIKQSLKNLRTFPYVAQKEAAGEIKLHGCHFAIGEGQLYVLDEDEDSFILE